MVIHQHATLQMRLYNAGGNSGTHAAVQDARQSGCTDLHHGIGKGIAHRTHSLDRNGELCLDQ
jgi:hypothetical protein